MHVLLSLLIFSCLLLAKPLELIVVADDNYPPYSYTKNAKPAGIYNIILKKIFSKMPSYNVTIRPMPWKRALQEVEQGKVFAISPPYYHINKRPFIWPYSMPILDEKVALYCHKELTLQRIFKEWPRDYFGLRIGKNNGFALGGRVYEKAVLEQKILQREYKNNKLNLISLSLNRIDCYMNDALSIEYEIQKLQKKNFLSDKLQLVQTQVISQEQGFLGFSRLYALSTEQKESFLKEFNTLLYDMKRKGEIEKIIKEFLNASKL